MEEKPTERMIRLYMEFCNNRKMTEGSACTITAKLAILDPFAKMKLVELLELLHSKNLATKFDYKQLIKLCDHSDNSTQYESYLESALNAAPSSTFFWNALLNHKMKRPKDDLVEVFEKAVSKVESFRKKVKFRSNRKDRIQYGRNLSTM